MLLSTVSSPTLSDMVKQHFSAHVAITE